jgi:hypothetical protein
MMITEIFIIISELYIYIYKMPHHHDKDHRHKREERVWGKNQEWLDNHEWEDKHVDYNDRQLEKLQLDSLEASYPYHERSHHANRELRHVLRERHDHVAGVPTYIKICNNTPHHYHLKVPGHEHHHEIAPFRAYSLPLHYSSHKLTKCTLTPSHKEKHAIEFYLDINGDIMGVKNKGKSWPWFSERELKIYGDKPMVKLPKYAFHTPIERVCDGSARPFYVFGTTHF